MTLLILEASSSAAAADIVTAIDTGTLYGINLGTTTKSSTYSNLVLLELTQNRAFALCEVLPSNVESGQMDMDPPSFSSASSNEQLWFLRGKL
jgi:hypothetical protein